MGEADVAERAGTGFRGPYAGGPPPEALRAELPRLDRFGPAELRRALTANAVITLHVLQAVAVWLLTRGWSRRRRQAVSLASAASEGLIDAFCTLGPIYVKLGQLMASSPSVFPAPLADAALRCIREVEPFEAATARAIIEEDLGRPAHEIFAGFSDRPLAAASVAQVHACILPDGRQAVVKLQRPGISSTWCGTSSRRPWPNELPNSASTCPTDGEARRATRRSRAPSRRSDH
jgi:hypothetical protein